MIANDLDEPLKLADHLAILMDGEIDQQGEPHGILLSPANPYKGFCQRYQLSVSASGR